jgi:hypothetical protein
MAMVMGQGQNPVDMTEHLTELLQGIDFAFQQSFEPNTSQPVDSVEQINLRQQEQIRYATALAVVGRFFARIDRVAYADRFFDLSNALSDLSIGSRPPILKVQKRQTPPNPTQIEVAKAGVASALDALIALGELPQEAARHLLARYPNIKRLAGPKSQRTGSWEKTILEWRKSLSAPNRRKNLLAAEVFSAGRDLIKCLIKEGRPQELRARAYGWAKRAALTGVFVAPTDPP